MHKRTALLALTLLLALPAQAQIGISNVFRSLSGALRGDQDAAQPQQQGVTPVMGVRGIDDAATAKATGPANADYALMEGWAASKAAAQHAAAAKHLAARQVAMRKSGTANAAQ